MYYIGVDGGGTKTLFTLFDDMGTSLDVVELGPCHHAQIGYDGLEKIIRKGVGKLLKKQPDIHKKDVFVSMGLAGYGQEKKVRAKMEKAIAKALEGFAWFLTNDIETALTGALNGNDGILVIAGTGSIAMLKQNESLTRIGGWGYMIGDEGSAYWLAKKMLAAFSKMADGRLPQTALYGILKEALNLAETADIISYVALTLENKREKIAELTPYLSQAASLQDEVALQIFDEAAKELALMVNVLANQSKADKVMASYVGGVFKSGDFFMSSLIKYLDSKVLLIAPMGTPCDGAYLLAKKHH